MSTILSLSEGMWKQFVGDFKNAPGGVFCFVTWFETNLTVDHYGISRTNLEAQRTTRIKAG